MHCAVTDKTRGMISRDLIAKMKPAFFMNNAGDVVDGDLSPGGKIAGAGLDVFMDEPLRRTAVL